MSEPNIKLVSGDDDAMNQAARRARETFRFYWREQSWEYRRIIPSLAVSTVKVAFSDPPEMKSTDPDALEVEYMWVGEIQFDGQQVTGVLMNDPHSLRSISDGDEVNFPLDRVCDWMYAIRDRAYGGFTVQLMRSQMSASERKQHDNAWGLSFGDPENILVVPPDHIGDEPAKGGLFSMFSKPKDVPQDYDAAALIEHPMSGNMRASLDKALTENPEMLHSADDKTGFTILHQLALGGSADGVDVAIQKGADVSMKTQHGMTALDLAKVLDWKNVITLLECAG